MGSSDQYDRERALYPEDVLGYIKDTQPEAWEKFCKIHPQAPEDALLNLVTRQLEKADPIATSMGIYPQLSALEMLLYPKSALVIANTVLMAAGTIEVIPPEAPFTLFIWGPKRVLPVRLTGFTITEEAHDPSLNPIRAKASLDLRVLSYSDFSVTHPGYALFLAHQVVKETMAVIGSVGNITSTGASI